ncbi:MAG: hypothetical protein SFH39_10390 [Candidatus Magnetobacterium sp. LHC-1]
MVLLFVLFYVSHGNALETPVRVANKWLSQPPRKGRCKQVVGELR